MYHDLIMLAGPRWSGDVNWLLLLAATPEERAEAIAAATTEAEWHKRTGGSMAAAGSAYGDGVYEEGCALLQMVPCV